MEKQTPRCEDKCKWLYWRKPLCRMEEEGTEQVKGASECSAGRTPVNGWKVGLEDLRLQCNSEKEAVQANSLTQYPY